MANIWNKQPGVCTGSHYGAELDEAEGRKDEVSLYRSTEWTELITISMC